MKHKTSQTLFAYWNEVRGERVAPRRFEIEPSRIAAILAETFILECAGDGVYRFRLAGTRTCTLLGRELRDSTIADLFRAEDRSTLLHLLSQATEQAPVTVLTFEPQLTGLSLPRFEMLLLPLLHTQDTVTRFLGSLALLDPHHWREPDAPIAQTLLGHETIWPDGRPRAVLDKLRRQSPFAPEHRMARIVTADRRRFRVFDGGLAKSELPE